MSAFSKDDYADAVAQVIHMTKFIMKHTVGEDMENLLDARDLVEDILAQLTPEELKAVREFDRSLLCEIDWVLSDHDDLAGKKMMVKIDRRRWWWYLHEIKAGTMKPPADLKGAA